jgi:hypothetical protein
MPSAYEGVESIRDRNFFLGHNALPIARAFSGTLDMRWISGANIKVALTESA